MGRGYAMTRSAVAQPHRTALLMSSGHVGLNVFFVIPNYR